MWPTEYTVIASVAATLALLLIISPTFRHDCLSFVDLGIRKQKEVSQNGDKD